MGGTCIFDSRAPHLKPTLEWQKKGGMLGSLTGASYERVFLYDLENDPFERNNLAFTHRDLAQQLLDKAILLTEHTPPECLSIGLLFGSLMSKLKIAIASLI